MRLLLLFLIGILIFIKTVVSTQVHRRLLHDDAFGVGEPLNETENNQGLTVYGHHTVLVNKRTSQEALLQLEKFHAPWVYLTPANEFTWESWGKLTHGKASTKVYLGE